jgi:DnaJ-class molecular chaperone
MSKKLYTILELEPNCSDDEIKSSYKKLAKQYHPDKNKSVDAAEKMKEINNAYKILSEKRSEYDTVGDEPQMQDFDPTDMFRSMFNNTQFNNKQMRVEIIINVTVEDILYIKKNNLKIEYNKTIDCQKCFLKCPKCINGKVILNNGHVKICQMCSFCFGSGKKYTLNNSCICINGILSKKISTIIHDLNVIKINNDGIIVKHNNEFILLNVVNNNYKFDEEMNLNLIKPINITSYEYINGFERKLDFNIELKSSSGIFDYTKKYAIRIPETDIFLKFHFDIKFISSKRNFEEYLYSKKSTHNYPPNYAQNESNVECQQQ